MATPPEGFLEEFAAVQERMEWAENAPTDDVSRGKILRDEYAAFFSKWHPVIREPEVRAGMEHLHRIVVEDMTRELERVFAERLGGVIQSRKDWLVAELLLQGNVAIIGLRKEMPEKLRAEFEEIIRDTETGKPFDNEEEFRRSEQDCAEKEAAYRKALAGLEVDWPERMDAPLRERLEKLDVEGANAWQAEIAAQQAAVK